MLRISSDVASRLNYQAWRENTAKIARGVQRDFSLPIDHEVLLECVRKIVSRCNSARITQYENLYIIAAWDTVYGGIEARDPTGELTAIIEGSDPETIKLVSLRARLDELHQEGLLDG